MPLDSGQGPSAHVAGTPLCQAVQLKGLRDLGGQGGEGHEGGNEVAAPLVHVSETKAVTGAGDPAHAFSSLVHASTQQAETYCMHQLAGVCA